MAVISLDQMAENGDDIECIAFFKTVYEVFQKIVKAFDGSIDS